MSKVIDHLESRQAVSDLERILVLAEDIHEKCARCSQRVERYRGAQMFFILSFFAGIVGFIIGSSTFGLTDTFKFILTALSLIALMGWIVLADLIRNVRHRTTPDLIALARLVELLRETESALGEAENWSTLDRAQFRIRLSRFGIGPEGWHT